MIVDMNDQDIENYIAANLPIRSLEKDQYGEVATPKILIDELLDALPHKVWSEPQYKWLDPAAGKGNFPVAVYSRLFRGLAKRFPHPTKRSRHIIDNMLYMVEINGDSAAQLRKLFGKGANVLTADFLADESSKITPNIIIGNPPFQKPKTAKYLGGLGNRTLWDKFVLKSLNRLAADGFLGFITPANWRRPDSDLYRLMTGGTPGAYLRYLHIYGKKAAKDFFGIQSRIDLYVLSKKGDEHPIIVDEKGETHRNIDPRDWPFLPNYDFPYIKRILVEKGRGFPVLYDSSKYDARHLSKKKTRKYRYPVVHTMTRKGMGIRYANNRTRKHFGVPKVLLNANERLYPYNDYLGKYGMSQLTFGLPIKTKKEGEFLVKRINSADFQEMIKATKWGAFQTDHRLFDYIEPDPHKWPR